MKIGTASLRDLARE